MALAFACSCGGADAGMHPAPQTPVQASHKAPPKFDAQRAWSDLEAQVALGPRQSGTGGAESARKLIEERLKAAGYASEREPFVADTPEGPLKMANVYADLAATSGGADAQLVILCSHFDTKRTKPPMLGANDGGSSTAVLLELARVLKEHPDYLSGRFAYRFLFLDGEEAIREQWVDPDNCYGSRHHVQRLKREDKLAHVAAVILLDLIGDKDLHLERETFSDQVLLELVFAAAREGDLGQHVPKPADRGQGIKDDHVPFLHEGLRAIDLIDFSYGPNNSYWHTTEDTLEHCSADSLGAIGRIVLLALPSIEAALAP